MAATPPTTAHPGFSDPATADSKAAAKANAKANSKAPQVEVVFPDQPPELEKVAVLGPLRLVMKNKDRDRTEREAVENDFGWFRYSTCAAPCLFLLFSMLLILLGLSFWQMSGGLKEFQNDIPRYLMLNEFYDDDEEGNGDSWVRDLRISYLSIAAFTVVMLFAAYLKKPALGLQRLVYLISIFFLLVVLILSLITFSKSVNANKGASQCPIGHFDIPQLQQGLSTNKGAVLTASQSDNFFQFGRYHTPQNLHTSYEPCKDEYKLSVTATIVDGLIAFLSLWTMVALVFVVLSKRGFWRRRRGWRAQQEAEKDFFKGSKVRPGPLADQSVHVVRTQFVTVLLLLVAAFVIAQALIIIVLHYNKTTYTLAGPFGHTSHSAFSGSAGYVDKDNNSITNTLYRPGWPAWCSRIRVAAASLGLALILLTFTPHRSRIMATLLAWGMFGVWCLALTSFIADISELDQAADVPCPVNTQCDYSPFIGTVTVTFFFLVFLAVYLLNEFLSRCFTTCMHCDRDYTWLELSKHENKLCSRRTVKCGISMVSMKAYEYRSHRAVAHTAPQEVGYPQPVVTRAASPASSPAPVEEWAAPAQAPPAPAAYPALAQVPYDQGYRPFLGITVQDNQAPNGSIYVSVTEVNQGGPSARSGLMAGDTIAAWQRPGSTEMEQVTDVNDWNGKVHSCRPGDSIHVDVIRNQPDAAGGVTQISQTLTIQIGGMS